MSDQVKISFRDDGTLVIDTEGLDESLREKLFQRGTIIREGDKVKVYTLGPLPWDASIPADADCLCGSGRIIVVGPPPPMNDMCACGAPLVACGEPNDPASS